VTVALPKDPAAGDGNQCRNIYNVEYMLRKYGTTAEDASRFYIYPAKPGSPTVTDVNLVYIQGADRATACPEASFLAWSETNCGRSNNVIDGTVSASLYYMSDSPFLAKIDLVGPLQATRFKLTHVPGDSFNSCTPTGTMRNLRIMADVTNTSRCYLKWLGFNSNPIDTNVF